MIVIIGGGISGLWILATLRNQGYNAILVEKSGLGAGQTFASQGIIHGGTKYALTGRLSGAAKAISKMPQRWLDALEDKGAVKLSQAKLFSSHQYLWTINQIGGKLTTFFASKLMRSRMKSLVREEFPEFLPRNFSGGCYALEEPVFDLKNVTQILAETFAPYIFTQASWEIQDQKIIISQSGNQYIFPYEKIIYTAGSGNAEFTFVPQQLRPLHMMALRINATDKAIYGHCLGLSDKPKITVTTHPFDYLHPEGDKVLWIGGQPAENGIDRSHDEQVLIVQNLLQETLPWIDTNIINDSSRYCSVFVNRAEGAQEGKRPDLPVIVEKDNKIIVWPTKLAFAPLVGDQVLEKLGNPLEPQNSLPFREMPAIADYPWQHAGNFPIN